MKTLNEKTGGWGRALAMLALSVIIPLNARAQQAPANGVEATSVPLAAPAGLAYDAAGNLYIASLNQNVIRKVDLKGIITTVAGTGEQGFAGDGGPATAAILDSPAGIAVDAAGDLFIADTRNHRIREVAAATGIITTIAGTGVKGFSGDGGAATAATLAGPQALALDSAGNLYIADTDNHRVRRITGTTISTVAGDGEQFFSGDNGAATAAGLDSPSGVALDASNNLYIGDTHNQRVRVVNAATGIITTFAGTGAKTFAGDSGAATAAALARPRGLAFDSAGRLYISDSDNNRVRTISGTTITTLAGDGEQGFSGDTGLATSAALDTPRAAASFGSGATQANAFTDTSNSRARAVSANGQIETVAGLGAIAAPTLTVTGAASIVYGTGTLTVKFANQGKTASGTVTLLEGFTSRATCTLSGNACTLTLPVLAVGEHSLAASFPGDSTNAPAASGTFVLTVTQDPLLATANPVTVAYGLPIPALTGTLTGVLPMDAGNVTAVFSTTAMQGSNAGSYPITVSLTGSAAAEYSVTTSSTSGAVTITAAPTATALTVDNNPTYVGVPINLTATVTAATAGTVGTPNGSVNFLGNGALLGNVMLTGGVAKLQVTPAMGSTQFTAVYLPSTTPVQDWTTSSSNTINESVLADPDFSLAATPTYQTVLPGQSVSYTINVVPAPAPFNSAVTFTVSGLPAGAAASFAPVSVTPGSGPAASVLTVKTAPTTGMMRVGSEVGGTLAFTLLLWPLALRRRRNLTRLTATFLLGLGTLGAATVLSGCGSSNGFFEQPAKDYTLTITGTSTSATSATLVRTTTVTLNLQ